MFCGKCGTKNSDDAVFCKECGAPIGTAQKGPDKLAAVPSYSLQSSQRNRVVGIAAVGVVAVVVIALLFALLSGRSYKSTVTKFLDATFEADAKTILNLVPDNMIDYMLDDTGYDRADMNDALDELSEELQDEIDYITRYLGDDWKVSYEILSTEDISAKELRELKSDYEEYDVAVSTAKNVEVTVTVKAADMETSNTIEIPVIKVGRSWYLDVENLASIF